MKPHHRSIGKVMRTNARRMRHRATDAEAAMWRLLRDRRFEGLKFRRQFPFQYYILDFVCFAPRVVIEIDGSQHFGAAGDQQRAKALQKEGFEIIRYWNNDLLKRPALVLEDLFHRIGRLKASHPSPGSSLRSEPPSPTRGEGEDDPTRGEGEDDPTRREGEGDRGEGETASALWGSEAVLEASERSDAEPQ